MALSRERIADELLKLLGLPDPSPTVALMLERGDPRARSCPKSSPTPPPRVAALVAAERDADIAPDPLRRLAALLPRDPAAGGQGRRAAQAVATRPASASPAPPTRRSTATRARSPTAPAAIPRATGCCSPAGPAEAAAVAGWPIPRLPLTRRRPRRARRQPGPRSRRPPPRHRRRLGRGRIFQPAPHSIRSSPTRWRKTALQKPDPAQLFDRAGHFRPAKAFHLSHRAPDEARFPGRVSVESVLAGSCD